MTLDEIGKQCGTDKSSAHHNYLVKYEKILEPLRFKKFCIWEIGYGGYWYKDRGGNSARMWAQYFPFAQIVSLESWEKNSPTHDRIKLIQGSQNDEKILKDIVKQYNPLVINDDGSHICKDVIHTFETVFPLLQRGAIYIVEDVHSSYWDEIAADGTDFGGGAHENTTQNYFKRLTDLLNYEHLRNRFNVQEHLKDMVESIQFFKEFIVITRA